MIWESFKAAFDRSGDRPSVGTDIEQNPKTSSYHSPPSQQNNQYYVEPIQPAPPAYSPPQRQKSSSAVLPSSFNLNRKTQPAQGYDAGGRQTPAPPGTNVAQKQKKNEKIRTVSMFIGLLAAAGIIYGVMRAIGFV